MVPMVMEMLIILVTQTDTRVEDLPSPAYTNLEI